ncbi:hypothetical protein PUMCH_002503 [Australozyma saopauloensis]|uniref:Mediator of RNA polymerase II transcription subunit 12 n=1 Tax=Australozyma saopauloensis TaxID=291208 RepID=A0AAX4H9P9_9ASCO|nr:hypothetical protein PUMCH_002503 [[Candida] saopauloensis]
MSKQKNKNSLLASHARASPTVLAKDELLAMKYVMDKPQIPIYPLGEKPPQTYPDFCPWDEPDLKNEKLNNSNFLNKGYFESPQVSNEYYSARNLIQETLFSSSANCTKLLNELSLNLTNAFRTRNEVINKISHDSASFKLPPRVTLTALKREAWLKDLANPDIPLQNVSSKIPHGIRNKVLIECMSNYNVPTSRALWFTKCVLYSEQLLIRKKLQAKVNSVKLNTAIDIMEARYMLEWTLHVTDYLLKFSREMETVATAERKAQYHLKLNYLLSFVKSLYIECLINKTAFLSGIINFLREDLPFRQEDLLLLLELSRIDGDDNEASIQSILDKLKPMNYGQILVGLTLVKTFWTDIIKEDFLCKATSEALLLNYFLIEKICSEDTTCLPTSECFSTQAPLDLKNNILKLISTSITDMFNYNSNVFIVPEFWILIGDVLYHILMSDGDSSVRKESIESTLKLISYRNESLMLNMKYSFKRKKSAIPARMAKSGRKNSFLLPALRSGRLKDKLDQPLETDFTYFGGSKNDILRFINQLDKNKLNNFVVLSLTPKRPSDVGYLDWKIKLKVSVYWSVSAYRDMGSSSVRILTFCNFLKRKVLHGITGRGSAALKAEVENEILESVFSLASEPRSSFNMKKLYVLINELYQLKIITISSYLRKIIACGIFYATPSSEKEIDEFSLDPLVNFHISILQNFPVLNNKQCDHILKKWTNDGSKFNRNFKRGIELAQKYVVDAIVQNKFDPNYNEFLEQISELEMGVKFLIVNWLTSQIKTTISKSPKLIHFSPSTIANIFRFYETTDNLTVFYKALVKFLLKNEDKIIIFYLETLYFICKLLISHYPLIKLIAGQTHETSSVASELFKLVLLCYKDISSRETDVYRFSEIWDFIAKSMEKPSTVEKPNRESLRSLIFDKDTAESPLSIQTHALRRKDFYSPEQFQADLHDFVSSKTTYLTEDEIKDCLQETQIPQDELNNAFTSGSPNFEHTILLLLEGWYSRDSSSESVDLSYFKLIENLRKLVKASAGEEFYSAISSFFLTKNETNCDLARITTFLRKLLSFELFLIVDLLTMIENSLSRSISFWNTIVSSLLFESAEALLLLASQTLLYEVLLNDYKLKNLEHLYGYAVADLKAERYGSKIQKQLEIIMSSLILNQRTCLELLIKEFETPFLVTICNKLIGESEPIENMSQICSASIAPDEFSLPVWQLLLTVLSNNAPPSRSLLGETALSIIQKSRFLFGSSNSFFGELFDTLSWEYRHELFYFFEESFFASCDLCLDEDKATADLVVLHVAPASQNMLAIFKEFFKKFSCPSVEKFETLSDLLLQISLFLKKLTLFLNLNVVNERPDESIYNMVSIYLRILIIHNATLAEEAARSDLINLEFFQGLVDLLNSEYLSKGHEKLQILLYDLLLMMKSTLTQILATAPSESLLETLPEVSQSEGSGDQMKTYNAAVVAEISNIIGILNLPEPKTSLLAGAQGRETDCIVTLDDDELNHTGDIYIVNNEKLEIVSNSSDSISMTSPFGVPSEEPKRVFNMNSVALIENPSSGINNGCVNLALFDAYSTKENPL